jgi:murein L,D-transpeptidase YafK
MKRQSAVALSLAAAIVVAAGTFALLRYLCSTASGPGESDESSKGTLEAAFSRAGVPYPPVKAAFLGLKAERRLEVWARHQDEWRFIRSYPIKAASGRAGPKLREGDRQVPEGVYHIVWLNPNSSYHLSMKLDYPNDFDRRHAREEGRTRPGGDIFIHGNAVSIGCLAMGDAAIEELYALVEGVGPANTRVLIAPHDPRTRPLPRSLPGAPSWLPELYERLETEFKVFKKAER